MSRRTTWLTLISFLTIPQLAGNAPASTSNGQAVDSQAAVVQDELPVSFEEAEVFLELNDTDGDLGIHASLDGGPWKTLAVLGPGGRRLLDLVTGGALRRQGMTQLFFESAEPSFEELEPAEFLRRFPAGRYRIEGRAQGGGKVQSTAVLSHVLAAPPDNVRLSGMPAAESCDDAHPIVVAPVSIDWDPVTSSHPKIGKSGRIRIVRYQLFVEGEEHRVNFSVDLPPSVTEFEVPMGVTDLDEHFKFEIIARTSTGNNTAVESCFQVN